MKKFNLGVNFENVRTKLDILIEHFNRVPQFDNKSEETTQL